MIGVILCGGQSVRMGTDKGLLLSGPGKKVWAEIMKEKFNQISIPSLLSINPGQIEYYLKYFGGKDLVVDNPDITFQGPLLGLLSVHLKYHNQDLMVVACDMINMDGSVLMKLFSNYESSHTDAIAFTGEQVEPLCAIYSSRGLSKILAACHSNELFKNSMMHVLEELGATYIPISEEWRSAFKNFNNVKDLNELKS
jgi:molybdenum cofactor guanylyltransferase